MSLVLVHTVLYILYTEMLNYDCTHVYMHMCTCVYPTHLGARFLQCLHAAAVLNDDLLITLLGHFLLLCIAADVSHSSIALLPSGGKLARE